MSQPLDMHWKAVKHILRYLKGILFYGLNFKKSKNASLQAYCDAD